MQSRVKEEKLLFPLKQPTEKRIILEILQKMFEKMGNQISGYVRFIENELAGFELGIKKKVCKDERGEVTLPSPQN